MAAGLADQILEKFATKSVLKEGHDGVYEIWLDQKCVYSSKNSYSGISSSVEILWSIGQQLPVVQGEKLMKPLQAF